MADANIRTRDLELDGYALRVRQAGDDDAPPILCVHGGPGMDGAYFLPGDIGAGPGLHELTAEYRVISYDQRGCGASTAPTGADGLALSHHIDDIERVRQALGLGPVAILGHSFGTVLALLYALRHPSGASQLILLGGAPDRSFMDGYRASIQTALPETARARLAEIEAAPLTDATFRERFMICLPLYFADPPEPAVADRLFPPDSFSALVNRSVAVDLQTYDLSPALPQVRAPALVLYGERDRVILPRYQLAFRGKLLTARFVAFADSGHFPFLEEPDAFARVTHYFLQHGAR